MSELEPRVQLLRRACDAFNRRDIDTVLSLLDPAVEWPNMLDLTTARGHQAVRDYWERQFERIDSCVEPTEFVADGDRVIVDVHHLLIGPDEALAKLEEARLKDT